MISKIPIPSYETARVLVCGDLMLDRYWHGDVSRISPEAPVPVVQIQRTESRPGGAANVAYNIATLGAAVTVMGLVGHDPEAHELRMLLEAQKITCHFESLTHFPTITKLRVLGHHQQLLRLDFEKPQQEGLDTVDFLAHYRAYLAQTQVVVLSDYAKGALNNLSQFMTIAREQGIPVLVDPKAKDFSRYRGATLITPNLKEFEAVVGPCTNDAELITKARELSQLHDFTAVLVTRGSRGMVLVHREHEPLILSAHAAEVYDVTGAGDTVIAVIAASLAAKTDLSQAVMLANLAAGLVVKKLGTAAVSLPELRREWQKINNSHCGIMSRDELLLSVADARDHGETIVMTNGCFDVLHAGHVHYLEEAKALGDRLIVAVNDDDSVRYLKGPGRPLNTLSARMEILAALRAVDWVVPFSETTPAALIAAVAPDVLVKGGDYSVETIAGATSVRGRGGKVFSLALKPGFSTSALIEKIRGEKVL
ncbi:MAG: bifunctional heptose 7-phosphate kinase/heptose 1-phosphate adenyltransferase [Coxiella sp. RIFCSPHIGHO2_12_FULL_44_14]|nr:MAG: bifunctional heptose 7-phosphate kinase/heptose 1-phosphate adenyltransferase [Coxiella sp. RIFCSPHIGHO2_12_FULL_44_14]